MKNFLLLGLILISMSLHSESIDSLKSEIDKSTRKISELLNRRAAEIRYDSIITYKLLSSSKNQPSMGITGSIKELNDYIIQYYDLTPYLCSKQKSIIKKHSYIEGASTTLEFLVAVQVDIADYLAGEFINALNIISDVSDRGLESNILDSYLGTEKDHRESSNSGTLWIRDYDIQYTLSNGKIVKAKYIKDKKYVGDRSFTYSNGKLVSYSFLFPERGIAIISYKGDLIRSITYRRSDGTEIARIYCDKYVDKIIGNYYVCSLIRNGYIQKVTTTFPPVSSFDKVDKNGNEIRCYERVGEYFNENARISKSFEIKLNKESELVLNNIDKELNNLRIKVTNDTDKLKQLIRQYKKKVELTPVGLAHYVGIRLSDSSIGESNLKELISSDQNGICQLRITLNRDELYPGYIHESDRELLSMGANLYIDTVVNLKLKREYMLYSGKKPYDGITIPPDKSMIKSIGLYNPEDYFPTNKELKTLEKYCLDHNINLEPSYEYESFLLGTTSTRYNYYWISYIAVDGSDFRIVDNIQKFTSPIEPVILDEHNYLELKTKVYGLINKLKEKKSKRTKS